MNKLKEIPINIWDDYYEDGYVPEGEKQETYIYVENSDIPLNKQKDYLESLLYYMDTNLKLKGVKMWIELYDSEKLYPNLNEKDNPLFMKEHPNFHFKRWKIKIENLTHKRREELVNELEKANLAIDDVPLNIYSES